MPAYASLTAADFELKYDETHTYPFYEDEDSSGLYKYGHDDDAEFARLANDYDVYATGISPEDAAYTAGDVRHVWAVVVDPELGRFSWRNVTAGTPNAFPVSVIPR
ncbi:hypothetical protein BKN37_13580 [Mycobacterium talmoniae]|uniref:Uncharacterized protein n=2 Tax=Mycobacterium talmoniae TaxID=1858794 RepID=A0A1S1NIP6_9MYCO|nr:hypothetical protein BKN37_13580 [Mycobacterium talmoniae]